MKKHVSRPIEMDLGVIAVVTEVFWYYAVYYTVGVWVHIDACIVAGCLPDVLNQSLQDRE